MVLEQGRGQSLDPHLDQGFEQHHIRHYKRIDYLKAFAIILVVFYHALIQVDISYSTLEYACVTLAMKNVHVPLFILIAGYLCHKQGVKAFYRKKVERILIPFLFFSALKLLVNNLLGTEFVHADTFPSQLWDAFVCGQLYWFCYCLLIMYAIAPLLWNRKALQWGLLIVLIGANIWIGAAQVTLTDVLQIQSVIYYSPFFVLGMLLGGYDFPGFRRYGPGRYICLAAALAGAAVTGYLRFRLIVDDRSYLSDFIFGICVMYLLYLLAVLLEGHKVPDKILSLPGRYSFQIMLLDPFWRMAVYALFSLFLQDGLLLAVIMTVLDLILSCITCQVLQHIPGISYLTGLRQVADTPRKKGH